MLENFKSDKFDYKRIPIEEQKARGILGRLAGIIADTKNPTRNGRLYSKSLWENVFNNDIMKEKIANRCVIGELNHPEDREETDLSRAAICLAEQPKISDDGSVYGVFDILDTPNGRILKTLCDYGCNIGVSSRGSGDLYTDENGNEAVDPDTYNCECWDAVIVPAVKAARLNLVTESLDKKRYNKTLRQTLTEELEKASDEDRKVMEESLDNLSIDLNEGNEVVNDAALDAIKDNFTPPVNEEEVDENTLRDRDRDRDRGDDNREENGVIEEKFYLRHDDLDKARDALLDKVDHEELLKALLAKNMKDQTIEDLCRQFGVEDKEFGYNVMSRDEMKDQFGVDDIKDLLKDESISESCGDKEEEINEEAGNAGDELVSQLQEALLKSKELEKDNLSLQEKLSVCNAKEVKLEDELKKYKTASISLSETAKETRSLKEEIANLNESLNAKDKSLVSGKERISLLVESKKKLSEELDNKKAEIEKLTSEKAQLSESLKDAKTKLDKSTSTIKRYQGALKESRDALVEFKANSCGLKKEEVLSKLNESFNVKEIDSVCEELTGIKRKMSKLPFRITEDTRISVKSSNETITRDPRVFNSDDEVSDYLYSMIK